MNTLYNNSDFIYYYDFIRSLGSDYTLFKKYLKTDMDILDIGCGSGTLSAHLSDSVRSITSFDKSDEMVNITRKKIDELKIKNINAFTCDMNSFDLKRKFDAIILGNSVIIENKGIDKHLNLIDKIKNHLSDGGILLVSVHLATSSLFNHSHDFRSFFDKKSNKEFSIHYESKIDLLNSLWYSDIVIKRREEADLIFSIETDLMTKKEFELLMKISNFSIINEHEIQKNSGFYLYVCKLEENK